MPSLRELQLSFAAALFDETDESVHQHVIAVDMTAEARLGIYRNNLHENFINALAIGFPVIERLVGADYFRQLALELLRAHPSRSGNLHHIGGPFPPYLREKFAATEYAYFADVAALEWAYQQAQVAADADALSAEAFRNIAPEDYERLKLELHPACGFVRSVYPIVQIWRANQPEAQDGDVIDLRTGGDNVLILRTAECVELHRLPEATFAFFEALGRGEQLGSALEGAQAVEADFDVAAALQHLIELRVLTGLVVAH
ncbi:MAG: DNA-binding domain-containing protein [Gammaproteobacteria bacterium]